MTHPATGHPAPAPGEPGRPPLDTARIAAATAGGPWRVEVVAASPSTNAAVAARAREGEPAGLVVVAEHQTAGRGRLDRTWVTPPRSALTLSALLAPDEVPPARWPWLPLLAGVAVADAVRRTCPVEPALKWPNDVLVGEAKVAGILVERVERADRERGARAVVGIGLNVSTTAAELPVPTATSLQQAAGAPVDRTTLLLALLDELGRWHARWRADRGDAARGLRAAYLDRCGTVGRDVRVELPDGSTLHGTAAGVDADGRLVVEGPLGRRVLGAGDVVHVRPR